MTVIINLHHTKVGEKMSYGINQNLLKSKIVLKGYNRNELADELGISPTSVTNLTKGRHNPSYELMNKLYKVLELTPEEGFEIFFANNLRDTKVC